MTLKETILQEALNIVQREGLGGMSETVMLERLDISQATFRELFGSIPEMVNQVITFDGQQQQEEHRKILADSKNAVEDIMLLLQHGIKQVKKVNPILYQQLQADYPEAWQIGMEHLDSYSYPQVHGILNKGVLEGNFRRDINITLVSKIILEQLTMMLNPVVFPPNRFDLAEVFRSIYFYYIRGICTELGAKIAENFFSNTNS